MTNTNTTTNINTHTHTNTYSHTHGHTNTRKHKHKHKYKYTQTHTHTHTHAHIHVCTHTHTHTHTHPTPVSIGFTSWHDPQRCLRSSRWSQEKMGVTVTSCYKAFCVTNQTFVPGEVVVYWPQYLSGNRRDYSLQGIPSRESKSLIKESDLSTASPF